MKRRTFIAGLSGAAAWPIAALPKKRSATVGVLMNGNENYAAFRQGLADFGYVGEQSISLILRDTAGNSDRLDQLAAELVALDPDVIFGAGSQSTMALKRQTGTIPIVTLSASPLGLGFVASLARPGGNITGVSLFGPEVAAKRIELLKEIIPNAATAAVFWNPDDPSAQFSLTETQAASTALRLNLRIFETRTLPEIDSAFSAATKGTVQAVILLPALFMGRSAGRIAELALANRLPTFGFVKAEPKAGELLSAC